MRREVEILAPAGSMESMTAAVNAGADAVYMGGSRFGARAYAENPQEEQFLEAIDYAHLHGCRLYMTVNTLVKERELEDLYGFLRPCYERGLDAVIVQDMGVFSFVREHFPDLPVHASTQMTVTGPGFAGMLKEQGASRIVTARELSLEEIARIHQEVDIEIESFVHGALCYCYSGQCLLSSLIGGRSGNRGRCAQPCRLPYEVIETARSLSGMDRGRRERTQAEWGPGNRPQKGRIQQRAAEKESYVMSLKDLCTLDILPDIIEAGVYSLKIEGRMKSPRYTAGVVSVYRRYVDRYLARGRKGWQVEPADRRLLLDLFDRGGQTEGYYHQHNGRDMVALKEKPAFRQVDQALFDRLDAEYVNQKKQEPVRGAVYVTEGEPARLVLSLNKAITEERPASGQTEEDVRKQEAGIAEGRGRTKQGLVPVTAGPDGRSQGIQVTGALVQSAKSQPLGEEQLLKQMRKTGNSSFYFEELEAVISGSCFLPVQAVNDLRRQGLEALKESVLEPYRRKSEAGPAPESAGRVKAADTSRQPSIHVLLENAEGLDAALDYGEVASIYLDSGGFGAKLWKQAADRCHKKGKRCVLVWPYIFRPEAKQYFTKNWEVLQEAGFDEMLVRSLETVGFLKEKENRLPLVFDANMYAMNHRAAGWLREAGASRLTFPLELNGAEIMELAAASPGVWELVAYGHLPAMVSAQCIRRTTCGCDRKTGILHMKDRTGKLLPVRNVCRFCYNTVYNPQPLSLLEQEKQVGRLGADILRLQFSVEDAVRTDQVIRAYIEHFVYKKDTPVPFDDFTRGHMKRGVE